ncbi:hypothetical protein BD779DRAFT_692548 [Infundibulicybe gibba]|nr:hypothetical protein BD779DRAFT_692548 [Infundibulicybe gibba]
MERIGAQYPTRPACTWRPCTTAPRDDLYRSHVLLRRRRQRHICIPCGIYRVPAEIPIHAVPRDMLLTHTSKPLSRHMSGRWKEHLTFPADDEVATLLDKPACSSPSLCFTAFGSVSSSTNDCSDVTTRLAGCVYDQILLRTASTRYMLYNAPLKTSTIICDP